MNTICLFTQNSRLAKKWKDLLYIYNEVKICSEFNEVKENLNEHTFVIFHDDSDLETIIKELDMLHESYEKKNTLVLRTKPDLREGEILLSHDIGGYGNANMNDAVFLQAIEVVVDGSVWLYPELMAYIIKKINRINDDSEIPELLNKLTDREKEVSMLVAKGETNKMIADDLSISQNTVKLHISSIFEKLDIKSRVALAILLTKAS